jgi:hypothetical protein
MAEVTTITHTYEQTAVKLSESEIAELHRINKMLNMRGFYFATGLSFALGAAWYLWVDRSPNGFLAALYPSMLTVICMMLMLPVHMWRVRRFSKRIGVENLYFTTAVLLDEAGNKLKYQAR